MNSSVKRKSAVNTDGCVDIHRSQGQYKFKVKCEYAEELGQ